MGKLIDLSGKIIGRLTVLEISHKVQRGPRSTKVFWLCKCDCGKTTSVVSWHLLAGKTQSCGCFAQERRIESHLKHGENKPNRTKEYIAWALMLQRCLPSNSKTKKYHAGRGVKVCDRWRSYENFLTDVGRAPTKQHSLDRINNDGHYEPGNVRWATRTEQNRNTRSNRKWQYKGESKILAEWCEQLGLSLSLMTSRLYQNGWTIEKAFETPSKHKT